MLASPIWLEYWKSACPRHSSQINSNIKIKLCVSYQTNKVAPIILNIYK